MVERCRICEKSKDATGEFCFLHNTVFRNLERLHLQWNKAFGEQLSDEDYYKKLLSLDETGEAAKTLIKYLQQRKGDK